MTCFRVLWLCTSAAQNSRVHNGCGWIASLADVLKRREDLQLGLCFEGCGAWGECTDNLTFYPMDVFFQRKNKLKRRFSVESEEKLLLPRMLRAIDDFKPDVIHIWGTECTYGIVCRHTKIPCILHLQGLLTPYNNATYPPGFSQGQFISDLLLHPVRLYNFLYFARVLKKRAEREIRILKECRNFLVRTEWDNAVVKLYHPEARCFYNSEMLRAPFMKHSGEWKPKQRSVKIISSVLSMPLYKGHDLILKTAKLLSERVPGKFVWNVYGVYSMRVWEKLLKICPEKVHVSLKGTVSAGELKDALLDTDVYVHPSYIDNSPNSLCEAQLLGVPAIATYVGGVPSLIENGKSGMLVPANDPWMLAGKIVALFESPETASELGKNAAHAAKLRHNPEQIVTDLLYAYRAITKSEDA